MELLVFMWSLQACASCYKSTACIYVTLKLLQFLMLANSHMLQLTMRNSFLVVETEAVAELGRGHPHQNLAQCSVAMLPVLSLLKEQTMRHYS
jgi:hypothetical protein